MNDNDYLRYYPTATEKEILIEGLKAYFAQPDKSQNRNMISKETSNKLCRISSHWNQRNVRLWFNNNKKLLTLHDVQKERSMNNFSISNPFVVEQYNKENAPYQSENLLDSNDSNKAYKKNDSHQYALSCANKKKVEIKCRNLQSTNNLLKSNQKVGQQENSFISVDANQDISSLIKSNYPIMADSIENKLKMKKDYSEHTYHFANCIRSKSPSIFSLIQKEFGLPSEYKLKKHSKLADMNFADYYEDQSKIEDIISRWKSDHFLKQHEIIHACLSVDALFFNPQVEITYENNVYGMILDEDEVAKLPEHASQVFNENPDIFESFLQHYKKKVVRSGFVFQIQSLSIELPTFVVHIIQSTTGKADQTIVDMLKTIKAIAKEHKILIRSFAFDGDSFFNELHDIYYKSYISKVINNSTIPLIKKSFVNIVVTDGLHLLKRLRYRFLSSRIHAGFIKKTPFIEIESVMRILHFLPSIVFNNEKFTKMNDNLPLKLFDSKSFVALINQSNFIAAAYWLPITSFIVSLTKENLSYEWQWFFLEVSFWFLVCYQKSKESCESPCRMVLKQRKRDDDLDVQFYTNEQLIQFTNTVHCHLQFMAYYGTNYCFDRNSSMPLEHKFGSTRISCKDINTLKKFIKSLADFDKYSTTFHELQNQTVNGRRDSFGICVSDVNENEMNGFSTEDYDAKEIALAFLRKSGFNVDINFDFNQRINWFHRVVQSLIENNDSTKKKSAKSNSLVLGSRGNIRSRFLIQNNCSFLPSSLKIERKNDTKEEPPFIRFLNLFTRVCMKEPTIDDYRNLYKQIKEKHKNCIPIDDDEYIESYETWFENHFFEYEAMIFQILNNND